MNLYIKYLLLALALVVSCNRSVGVVGNSPPDLGSDCADCGLATAQQPSCGGVSQPCCANGDTLDCASGLVCVGGSVCQAPADMAVAVDAMPLADMSMFSVDMSPASDLGVDSPECSCEHQEHGLGLGHCKENHVLNSRGHGNGHCKFDCD
jgi:hypothetical protein